MESLIEFFPFVLLELNTIFKLFLILSADFFCLFLTLKTLLSPAYSEAIVAKLTLYFTSFCSSFIDKTSSCNSVGLNVDLFLVQQMQMNATIVSCK